MVIGYNSAKKQYFIDRAKSGKIDFSTKFATTAFAPRLTGKKSSSDIELVIDVSSVELFADNGLTVMTSIFFPHKTFSQLQIQSNKGAIIKNLKLLPLKSIW
jgi:fructan beta-fructosidase